MAQELQEYTFVENRLSLQFLSERALALFKKAEANPFIKISMANKVIPFIILPDGSVVADITANNPKTILKNIPMTISPDNQLGAGFIDVYYSNRTLIFRHIESAIFGKRWHIEDIASALELELNLYYPGYQIGAIY